MGGIIDYRVWALRLMTRLQTRQRRRNEFDPYVGCLMIDNQLCTD